MKFCSLLVPVVLATFFAGQASATTITYAATSLGGGNWRYDYSVANDSLQAVLAEFTVYFDVGTYQNLAAAGAPAGWDAIVVQPDAGLPDDGFFDALAISGGIQPAASLAGFAVTFTYLGVGTPGAQRFAVVDPGSFAVLSSGTTTAVPGPATAMLLATGLFSLAVRRRLRQGWRP